MLYKTSTSYNSSATNVRPYSNLGRRLLGNMISHRCSVSFVGSMAKTFLYWNVWSIDPAGAGKLVSKVSL